jgi:pimeloyl-ACP methyl ester carboxylesterase
MPTKRSDSSSKETIVLIHGLWMTALCWEHWIKRYADRGHRVIATSWPGMDGDIEALRRDPSAVAEVGVTEIVEHYQHVIAELESPPIIIGHSFGGLVTQILLDRGFGMAGVAIDSAPVKGIYVLPFSTLKSALPALRLPLDTHKAVALTAEEFRYAFGNNLSDVESQRMFERYAAPGPNHVLFQASLANFNPHAATTVDFANDTRAPLLLIAGGHDHVVPASVTEANFKLYSHSEATTEYKEFPERSHFTIGEQGWEEVADFALEWATRHAAARHGNRGAMAGMAAEV